MFGGRRQRSSGADRYLAPTERVIHSCRKHPVVALKPVAIWLATLVGASALGFLVSPRTSDSIADVIAGWAVILVTVYLIAKLMQWWVARYVITDQRVIFMEGILNVKVAAIPLQKITDTTFTKTILGRLFGFGDLMLDSPGEHGGLSMLTDLPRPDQIYRLITSLVVGRVWDKHQPRRDIFDPHEEDTGPLPRVIV
ncbi:MAG: PH domain-containing protein [Actinomycetota bacterium]|nr:PH domain-containing protein [Actinomycetota bacterium]